MSKPELDAYSFFKDFFVLTLPPVLLVVLGIFLCMGIQPIWMSWERTVEKQSFQYVEAHESQMLEQIVAYNNLEVEILRLGDSTQELVRGLRGQQASILASVRVDALRMP